MLVTGSHSFEHLPALLAERSVILCGGSAEERRAAVEAACSTFRPGPRARLFRLNENLSSSEKFLRSAARELPLVSPLGTPPNQLSLDQIKDIWLDWVENYQLVWIVVPEAERYYGKEESSFLEMIGSVLTASHRLSLGKQPRKQLRLLLSMKSEIDRIAERVQLFVGRPSSDVRRISELFLQHFAVAKAHLEAETSRR